MSYEDRRSRVDCFTVQLGPLGAELARCRQCTLPTDSPAWASHGLLGLYCSSWCAERALLLGQHLAIGYQPEGVPA